MKRLIETQHQNALEMLAGNHSIDSQINLMGNVMIKKILEDLRTRKASSITKTISESIPESFFQAFPKSHRPPGTRIWAFRSNRSGCNLLEGPQLQRSKRTVMTQLFSYLAEISYTGMLAGHMDARANRLSKAIFGPDIDSRILGTCLEGKLTPIVFEYRKSYLYWKTIQLAGRKLGGIMIIFPDNLEKHAKPLQYVTEQIYSSFQRRILPVLQPLASNMPAESYVLPSVIDKIPHQREALLNLISRVRAEKGFKRGSIIEKGAFRFFRDYFSPNEYYEAFFISDGRVRETSNHLLSTNFFTRLWILWLLSLITAGILRKGLHRSLENYFTTLFFLLAGLPISAFMIIGFYQIDLSVCRQTDLARSDAIDAISEIDGQASSIWERFAAVINRTLNSQEYKKVLLKSSGEADDKIFNQLSAILRQNCLDMDCMMVFRPEHYGKILSKETRRQISLTERLSFVASSLFTAYPHIFDETIASNILLDARQENWQAKSIALSLKPVLTLIFSIMEKGNFSQFSQDDKSYYLLHYLSEHGVPKVFLLFLANPDILSLLYLKDKAIEQMRMIRRLTTIGKRIPGGISISYPSDNSSFWFSREGIMLKALMDRTSTSESTLTARFKDQILIATIPKNLNDFVIGTQISIHEILNTARRRKELIIAVSFLMLLLAVYTGGRINGFFLQPIRETDLILRKISQGNLNQTITIERDDELGLMSEAFNEMINGLYKRKIMGRFVSGTLDSMLGSVNEEAREIHGAVLTSDIRSFTSISESEDPQEVLAMLNRHLEEMSGAIREHGGHIDKFIGDAIIGIFFGQNISEAARSAVKAAVAMKKRHEELRLERLGQGKFTYEIGIGLDCGQMVAGYLTTGNRHEFSILGKPHENSERLETISKKGKHTRIMVSNLIYEMLKDDFAFSPDIYDDCRELARLEQL